MTHLRFNETLKDLKDSFEKKVIDTLRVFASLYFPVARLSRNPLYFDNNRKLQASDLARKLVEYLTVYMLSSPNRQIDGLCLVSNWQTESFLHFDFARLF